MYSAFPRLLIACLLLATSSVCQNTSQLRVCADPDNLPFSNRREAGFENQLARLVARDLNARLEYVWQRMGRGFVREYLDNSKCDVLVGVPSGYRPVLTTDAYYRSSFMFVARRQQNPVVTSLDDVTLRTMKIGVQVLEEDYTPPAAALARRGLQNNIVGFQTTGPDPGAIVDAVAKGKVDVAIVWGPIAGYYARRYGTKLTIHPIQPEVDPPGLPFTFAISMAVRKGNDQLRTHLQQILSEHRAQVEVILQHYNVPTLEPSGNRSARQQQ
jgi:mxaJ protein